MTAQAGNSAVKFFHKEGDCFKDRAGDYRRCRHGSQ